MIHECNIVCPPTHGPGWEQGVTRAHAPVAGLGRQVQAQANARNLAHMRHRLVGMLDEFGCAHLAEPVELVASELLTNALVHGLLDGGLLTAMLTLYGGRLVLSVPDNNPRPPAPADGGALAVDGRGVILVAVLADAWGFRCARGGKTVSAEFDAT